MKKIVKFIFLIYVFLLGLNVTAQSFNVLVLPADLFSVCENYYCFTEPSEIFVNDIIEELNKGGKISSPDIYTVRSKLSNDITLKKTAELALNKYKNSNKLELSALKKLAEAFKTNSILLVSASVSGSNGAKRSIWEVLEVSSAFETVALYNMEVNAVLIDNVNDVVMWGGKYNRVLGDNDRRFWAVNSAQAVSQLDKIKFYSKDIISKTISQQITLRFFPKTVNPMTPTSVDTGKETPEFKPNPLGGSPKIIEDKDLDEIKTETLYSF